MGREWEAIFADAIGGTPVPGSGNQWHSKLDVKGKKFLWSCKWTSKDWQPITQDIWLEAAVACDGLMGTGASPGLGLRSLSEDLVVFRIEDFIDILKMPPNIAATKVENKLATARVPLLLRD